LDVESEREAREAVDRLASLAATIGTVRAAADVRRQRHRSELEALATSSRTLELAAIAAGTTVVTDLVPTTVARSPRDVVVVIGQERGLCGDALDRLWAHPVVAGGAEDLPGSDDDGRGAPYVVVVGRRAALRARALGARVDVDLPGIVHPDGARARALDILDLVLGERFGTVSVPGTSGDARGGEGVAWPHSWRLLYARPRGMTDVEPVVDTLASPPSPASRGPKPRWPGRGVPWQPVGRARWVPSVVRAWCVHAILRAVVTTLAAENTLRSVAMERAERRAEELLDATLTKVRRDRMQRVDEELRDTGSWRPRDRAVTGALRKRTGMS
jgi:hypothetical protein